jgi:hypothetical protein
MDVCSELAWLTSLAIPIGRRARGLLRCTTESQIGRDPRWSTVPSLGYRVIDGWRKLASPRWSLCRSSSR